MLGSFGQVIIFIVVLNIIMAALKSITGGSGRQRRERRSETPYTSAGSNGSAGGPAAASGSAAHPYAPAASAAPPFLRSAPSAADVRRPAPTGAAVRTSAASARKAVTAAVSGIRSMADNGAKAVGSGKAANLTEEKPKEMTTLEYLERKAQEDAREHAEQKLEERRQARIDLGGRREGLRLLPGDPVLQGMRVSVCPYCGAENLIPYGSRDKFGCYFCREDLK